MSLFRSSLVSDLSESATTSNTNRPPSTSTSPAYLMNDVILQYIHTLTNNCRDIEQTLSLSLIFWNVVPLQCVFFSLFVFDIIGDEVGGLSAIWAPLLLLCFPGTIFFWFIIRSLAFLHRILYNCSMSVHSFIKEKAILGTRWNKGVCVQDNRVTSNNISLGENTTSNHMIDRGSVLNTSQPTFGVEMEDIA